MSNIDFSYQQALLISHGLVGPDHAMRIDSVHEVVKQTADQQLSYVVVDVTLSRGCDACNVSGSGTYATWLVIIDSRKPLILRENMDIAFY